GGLDGCGCGCAAHAEQRDARRVVVAVRVGPGSARDGCRQHLVGAAVGDPAQAGGSITSEAAGVLAGTAATAAGGLTVHTGLTGPAAGAAPAAAGASEPAAAALVAHPWLPVLARTGGGRTGASTATGGVRGGPVASGTAVVVDRVRGARAARRAAAVVGARPAVGGDGHRVAHEGA